MYKFKHKILVILILRKLQNVNCILSYILKENAHCTTFWDTNNSREWQKRLDTHTHPHPPQQQQKKNPSINKMVEGWCHSLQYPSSVKRWSKISITDFKFPSMFHCPCKSKFTRIMRPNQKHERVFLL